MKMALARKASKRLVDRKDEVLGLLERAAAVQPQSTAEAAETLKELEGLADELGLPLTGDEWGERLAIKKKGGGMHFDDAARGQAAAAYARLGVLHSSVTWHSQLESRSTQVRSAVGGFRCKGGAGAALSKGKMIERCKELLENARKTMADIFGDRGFAAAVSEMVRLGVPHDFDAAADGLRRALVLLAEFASELSSAEMAGLQAEKKLTQRFRAPQTLAVPDRSRSHVLRAVRTNTRAADGAVHCVCSCAAGAHCRAQAARRRRRRRAAGRARGAVRADEAGRRDRGGAADGERRRPGGRR